MSHVNARRKRQQGTEKIFEIAFPAARMGAGFHRVQGPARREQGGGQPVPRVGTWVHGVAGKGGQVSRLLCQAHCPCPCPSFPPTFSSPGEGKKGLMQMEKKQKCNGLLRVLGLLQQEERFAGGGAGSAHLRLLRRVSGLAPLLRHLWVPGTLPGAAKRSRFNG